MPGDQNRNIYRRPDGKLEIGYRDSLGKQRWQVVEGGISAARAVPWTLSIVTDLSILESGTPRSRPSRASSRAPGHVTVPAMVFAQPVSTMKSASTEAPACPLIMVPGYSRTAVTTVGRRGGPLFSKPMRASTSR